MKGWKTHIYLEVVVFCCMTIGSLAGCATTHIAPVINIERPVDYKLHQEQEGLTIAVHPIDKQEEMLTYFDDDLLKKGILPVLIVAENNNRTQTYLISQEQVSLKVGPTGTTLSSHGSAGVTSSIDDSRDSAGDKVLRGVGIVLFVGGPLALPLAFIDWGPTEHSRAVQHNIISKALQRKTLSQNQKNSGCVYLKLPSNNSKAATLVVTVEKITGGTPLQFEFVLDVSSKTSAEVKNDRQ